MGHAWLEDVLCRLVVLATCAQGRGDQLQLCSYVVVEPVVPGAESHQDDLVFSSERMIVIFLHSGLCHVFDDGLLLLVPPAGLELLSVGTFIRKFIGRLVCSCPALMF